MNIFCLVLCFFCFRTARADAEEFTSKWKAALAHFETAPEQRFFVHGADVAFRQFQASPTSNHIVIFPGYGESAHKYAEFILDLTKAGYSVDILSHQGMGESGRLDLRQSQKVDVESFQDYYADARTFVTKYVRPRVSPHAHVYLYAHSTGGLIGAHLLEEKGLFDAAVLSSPYFRLNGHGAPLWLIKGILSLTNSFRPTKYAPGFDNADPSGSTFESNMVTHSRPRWEGYHDLVVENFRAAAKQSSLIPIAVGGPSTRWVLDSLQETAPELIANLGSQCKTPTLIFQAGEDKVVSTDGQKLFAENAHSQLKVLAGGYHELYRETDNIRDVVIQDSLDFFRQH